MHAAPDALRLVALRHRLALLRWWLIGALLLAVLSAPTFLAVALPLVPLLALLLLMAVFNLVTCRWANAEEFRAGDLAGQLAVDLVAMGMMLYLTGGATNPLISLLLLPVAVAAFALPAAWAAALAALAVGLYSLLMFHALPLPVGDPQRALQLHLGGMWLTFAVSAALLVWFVARTTASLRARDQALAAAREEALRDAQVVALGQLAAGAAHELGTPLATMNVLAEELCADPRLPVAARADLDLLRRQIGLCKEIVGGLTQQAGIERAAQPAAADVWLAGLLARWRALHPEAACALDLAGPGAPPRVLPDAAIGQAVANLLDNAARVSPRAMRAVLDWDARALRIAVRDRGPGFPDEILRCAGAQPLASGGAGSGLGLWLARAAIERRGGRLLLENDGGGIARIELPLGETP